MKARLVALGIVGTALIAAAPAGAQALADPTRPPNTAPAGETQDTGPAGSQLQSILISRSRRLALINGESVSVGSAIGDARVVKITETEVTLQRGDETEVLRLFPGIEKQPARRGARISQKPSQQGRQQ